MKKIIPLLAVIAVAGCTHVGYDRASSTFKDGVPVGTNTVTKFRATIPFWSNSTLKGMVIDGETKTTSTGLRVSGSTIEPNIGAIDATFKGGGATIGQATRVFMGLPPVPEQ